MFRLADALHTEAALLHDALAAHRDIRVELPAQPLRPRILRPGRLAVAEPVEVPDLVRAVVRAVARADAAIVHLDVQSIRRVIGGVHRTHGFARRVAAVLTEHGNEPGLEIATILAAFPVALETDPVHLAPLQDVAARHAVQKRGVRFLIRGRHRGDVVLRIAGRDTGLAPRAAGQIHGHRHRRFAIPLQWSGEYIPCSLCLMFDETTPCASAAMGERNPGRYSVLGIPGIASACSVTRPAARSASSRTVSACAIPRPCWRADPSVVTIGV